MEYFQTKVINHYQVGKGIFVMELVANGSRCRAGQFFMLKTADASRPLMRPLSIYQATDNSVSFMYRISGQGTEELSHLKNNDTIFILGPLGNGFPCEKVSGRIALIGGGIGIAPLWFTAETLLKNTENEVDVYLGYRDELFALDHFVILDTDFFIATEYGDEGYHGLITDLFEPDHYDAVFACGPEPMMKAVFTMCKEVRTPLWISAERRMACGVGACLGCAFPTLNGVKRVCKDGPVFADKELCWES